MNASIKKIMLAVVCLSFILLRMPPALADGLVEDRSSPAAAPAPPVVVMLFTSAADIQPIQRKLQQELALELESHQLIVEKSIDFTSASLSDRMTQIRSVAAWHGARAAFWIEPGSDKMVTLQLVVLAPGRSTMRQVEATIQDDAIGELVIATKEMLRDVDVLLRDADLDPALNTAPPSPSMAASQPLNGTITGATVDTQPATIFGLMATEVAWGLSANKNDTPFVGGRLGFSFQLPAQFNLQLMLGMASTPRFKLGGAQVHSWLVRPAMAINYFRRASLVQWGPSLAISVPWQQTSVRIDSNNREMRHRFWGGGIAPGIALRLRLARAWYLYCEGAIAIQFQQKILQRLSNHALLYKGAFVGGNFSVGVLFSFN